MTQANKSIPMTTVNMDAKPKVDMHTISPTEDSTMGTDVVESPSCSWFWEKSKSSGETTVITLFSPMSSFDNVVLNVVSYSNKISDESRKHWEFLIINQLQSAVRMRKS